MKIARIALPLILALATSLAVTGCKHKEPPKTTMLKNNDGAPTGGPSGSPENLGAKPFNPGDNTISSVPTPPPPYTGGPIGTATNWNLVDYILDPAKLEAYTVHFKLDSSVVETSEEANVAAVAAALKADPTAKLLIEGHCDERGTEEYNRALGERRALALREDLAKQGVSPDLIRTISYGKDKPVDPGHDDSAWAKNRRGAFIWCTLKAAATTPTTATTTEQ
jgi:peptidoglycan-associated lipoprotein